MNVVCEDANEAFRLSLESVDCCDFYEDGVAYVRESRTVRRFSHEYEVIDGIVHSSVNSNDELYCRLLMREPIQLLHDLSVQLARLHREGYTVTDVDISDIANIDGRFCTFNTQKLVKFDKATGYGTLTFPPAFGRFVAPEARNVVSIPAVDAVHKNSAAWSIGMMFAKYVFNLVCDDVDEDDLIARVHQKLGCDSCASSIVPVIRRCIVREPDARMLIVV